MKSVLIFTLFWLVIALVGSTRCEDIYTQSQVIKNAQVLNVGDTITILAGGALIKIVKADMVEITPRPYDPNEPTRILTPVKITKSPDTFIVKDGKWLVVGLACAGIGYDMIVDAERESGAWADRKIIIGMSVSALGAIDILNSIRWP